jgi:hypothetical protein
LTSNAITCHWFKITTATRSHYGMKECNLICPLLTKVYDAWKAKGDHEPQMTFTRANTHIDLPRPV